MAYDVNRSPFCNSSISEPIYICMVLPFVKMVISGEKNDISDFLFQK